MTIRAHTRTRSDLGRAPAIWEAHAVAMTWLPWSEHTVTFDESDQPEHSVDVGRFPLVISAVLETVCATKIFMDEVTPILYIGTLLKD
jgi:hypothetical protein